ncbi:hypothetical protein JIN77_02755 [Verrucomicrobiaceae bacterium R5-34]|uniref:Uncharacterized protein n=1 Tax=Oceaniferula flava TaxID=2800421 RepID=A0AAE2S9U3_9BACT|nr:hypothetical protein [Oceaniferula flavus]MBK1829632.1 hypothetical protein [Verrucomicrobiaceae bacterium R5-34]MBK1853823.1 hypothetical protein [Oceaniferula flavus]MBM1135129.1 hypothetical protein [Oceaniferula flavus]
MKFFYPTPPDRLEHETKSGVNVSYSVEICVPQNTVQWSVYRHLPEGMHWKKGDEMGLGATHHEKTQTFAQFLEHPFRELPEDLNFLKVYVEKQSLGTGTDTEMPPLRYDGFPFGGPEILYRREKDTNGVAVSYFVSPHPYEKVVRWSFFPHLTEGICAKKGDESGLGSMHSDGEQTYAEFLKTPKHQVPDEVMAMVSAKMEESGN